MKDMPAELLLVKRPPETMADYTNAGVATMANVVETFRKLLQAIEHEVYLATSPINIYKNLDDRQQYQQVHQRYLDSST